MQKIKFGTDGWRAIIAKEFTTDNVARVSIATGLWVKEHYNKPSIVVGNDCRFAGKLFSETSAKIFASQGIKVYLAEGFVSTPMVSLAAKHYKASLGVVITASHNPPEYNGYKLKSEFGGPLLPEKVQQIEDLIPQHHTLNLDNVSIEELIDEKLIEKVDLESLYIEHVKKNFDIDAIKKSNIKIAYDAMYGAGQNVMKQLFPEALLLHCDYNPSFMGQAPEPIHKNLLEFSEVIKKNGNIDIAIATDGDADRIGLYGRRGEFIDSHHIILLFIHLFV